MDREKAYAYLGAVAILASLALLTPQFLSVVYAYGLVPFQTQTQAVVRSIESGRWSDPSVWSPRQPSGGDTVIISGETEIIYDLESSPIFSKIIVEGRLVFTRDGPTSLTVREITVEEEGYMEVGTRDNPIPKDVKAVIRLAAEEEGEATILVKGHLEMHGYPVNPTFTKLLETARAGEKEIRLVRDVEWKTGDKVVITSTSRNYFETEENIIERVQGNRVELKNPLRYTHEANKLVRGEVALLTRNVVITSLREDKHASGIVFTYGAKGGISYVELRSLGGKGKLGKYPIHFHHVKDSMKGTVIEGVAIWNSNNRFITIHDTDGITVRNSVGYNAIGHGFFLEDGNEMYNILENNIAILVKPGKIRPDDRRPAGFWIQNPVNRIINNIAVSSYGDGFGLAIPKRTPEVIPFDRDNLEESSWRQLRPRRMRILEFSGNEAHSNRIDGVRIYRLDKSDDKKLNILTGLKLWRNYVGIRATISQAKITNSIILNNKGGNMILDARELHIYNVKIYGIMPDAVNTLTTVEREASPFGILLTGTKIIIENSVIEGHRAGSYKIASADIIHNPRQTWPEKIEIWI